PDIPDGPTSVRSPRTSTRHRRGEERWRAGPRSCGECKSLRHWRIRLWLEVEPDQVVKASLRMHDGCFANWPGFSTLCLGGFRLRWVAAPSFGGQLSEAFRVSKTADGAFVSISQDRT